MRQYGSGSVRKRGSAWYIRINVDGQRIERRTSAKSRSEALAVLNELRGGVEKGTLTAEALSVRVYELYEALQHDYQVRGQRVADLDKRWKHLQPAFGSDRARDVSTPRLRAYVTKRQEQEAAPATIQRELACLRRMMHLGMEDARVTTIPVFPALRVDNTRQGFLAAETVDKLREALPEPVRTMFVVGYHLGWRKGELLALQWRSVDLDEGTIRLDPGTTKNREGRLAYLPEAAALALRAWRDETSSFERREGVIVPFVFHRDGKPVKSIDGTWRRACKAVGCPGLLFHDLRRTAARNYVRAGVAEQVAMKAMGHKTRTIFDRYNVTDEDDLKGAARALSGPNNGANQGQEPRSAAVAQLPLRRK